MTDRERAILKELYIKYYQTIKIYISRQIMDQSAVEDMVNEVFFTASEKPGAVLASDRPEAWLMVTARNKVMNFNTRKKRELKRIMNQPQNEVISGEFFRIEDEQSASDLMVSLSSILDPKEYEFFMSAAAGYTCTDLAQKYDISVSACHKRLQRIRERIRKELNADE